MSFEEAIALLPKGYEELFDTNELRTVFSVTDKTDYNIVVKDGSRTWPRFLDFEWTLQALALAKVKADPAQSKDVWIVHKIKQGMTTEILPPWTSYYFMLLNNETNEKVGGCLSPYYDGTTPQGSRIGNVDMSATAKKAAQRLFS